MRTLLSFLISLAFCMSAFAQDSLDAAFENKCHIEYNPHIPDIGAQVLRIDNETEKPAVKKVVYKILRLNRLEKSLIDITDFGSPSATAKMVGGSRIVAYNRYYLIDKINKTSEWSAKFVIAHELGHHLIGHVIVRGPGRPSQEDDADEWAAKMMYRMGASLEETLAWVSTAPEQGIDEVHGGRYGRKSVIEKAWQEEKKDYVTGIGYMSVGLGYNWNGSIKNKDFEYIQGNEYNLVLSVSPFKKPLDRILFELEIPLIYPIIETHDYFTTLQNEEGTTHNKYSLRDYKLNVIWYFLNSPQYKQFNMFMGGTAILYGQKPLKKESTPVEGSETFKEVRGSNTGAGWRFLLGARQGLGKRLTLDLYAGIGMRHNIKSESFTFNVFGNATPEPSRHQLINYFGNARLSYHLW